MSTCSPGIYGHDDTRFDFVRASFGVPSGPTPLSVYRVADTTTKALYGRANWTLTPEATLVTGLRVNRDEIGYTYNLRYNTTPASASVPFTRTDAASQNTTVGDVALRYKLSPNVMSYASIARGYKPAIWNLDGVVTATNNFRPSTVRM
ncbi:TonB-dependent receptor domain-containing protein [Pseudoduganella sp. UC29_106]|uniref:TonB-dependent receptor domain-containing protein n=1 Tax=Pseudoduganella sp. UC29_106 TaxID=3374553 RepID=UPI003756C32B